MNRIYVIIYLFLSLCVDIHAIELVSIEGGLVAVESDGNSDLFGRLSDSAALESPNMDEVVSVSDFMISRTEITVAQFKEFTQETGYRTLFQLLGDSGEEFWDIFDNENLPMHYISPFDAFAFCQWLSLKEGANFRLPTEAEWVLAARGPQGRIYPWGDDFKEVATISLVDAYRTPQITHLPVDTVEDVSFFGVYGMLGGSELVLDAYSSRDSRPVSNDNPLLTSRRSMLTRGDTMGYVEERFGLFYRGQASFFTPSKILTFRVVLDQQNTLFNLNTLEVSTYSTFIGYCNSENSNVRQRPGLASQIVSRIHQNEIILSLGYTKNLIDGVYWTQIVTGFPQTRDDRSHVLSGRVGWVASTDLSLTSLTWCWERDIENLF